MEWEEKKADIEYWKPEIGESIIGELINKFEGEFGAQYKLKLDDGREIVTPSHKVLQEVLFDVPLGTKVKIILDSERLPKVRGQNPTKIYKVFLAK